MTAPALWTATDAAEATAGQKVSEWSATGISIDTRSLENGDLFVALSGPNFDGHEFVASAFKNGAAAALVSQVGRQSLDDNSGLIVADTLYALRALGAAARARSAAKIAAITGSVGKTGTKEALAHVLAPQGATSFSKNSLNNHWGVPLSLARMPADTDFGIFEIGMNHSGEITPLVSLARPHVAVVTAIASAHMAFFSSLEEIARAKAEIFSGLDGGIAVINRDTEHFNLLAQSALATGAANIISFGRSAKADMRLIECESDTTGSSIEMRWYGKPLKFRIGQPGLHWAYNSLAVLATVDALGGNIDEAAAAMASLPDMAGRGAIHEIPWGNGKIRLIDDSYNANPESMNAALQMLGHIPKNGGRRVAILGDMLELGEISAVAHAGLESEVLKNDIDTVFLAGSEMAALADALPKATLGGVSDTAEGLLPIVLSSLEAGDIVSIKASNSIGFSRIVKKLTNAAPVERAANDT